MLVEQPCRFVTQKEAGANVSFGVEYTVSVTERGWIACEVALENVIVLLYFPGLRLAAAPVSDTVTLVEWSAASTPPAAEILTHV
jgi:hypothetical protein